jgi:signal transduction histidine kinase
VITPPFARAAVARRTRLGPLDQLRLRLTAWYVGTYAVILIALGTGLFFVVAHQIGRELDDRLAMATGALIEAISIRQDAAAASGSGAAAAPSQLRVPGVSLYIFDSLARPILPDSASIMVRGIVREGLMTGATTLQVASGKESELRAHLSRFRSPDRRLLIAVAAADLEDLEDRYSLLITQFVVAACIALAAMTIGGAVLARKSAKPVEAAVEHMRRFMADAGHELRTPVTVLRTEAEVALERGRDPVQDSLAFTRIAGEAAHLASVVEDLFTLARAESAQLPVERSAIFLDDIVSDAVASVGSGAAQKGVVLSLDEYQEAAMLGSATLLRRLIVILLDNAIKYTPAGGRVTVSVRTERSRVLVDVADTGVGIAPEAVSRVFDRFYRSDDGRSAAPGAGLGLSIARWIAEAHGGTLTLRSHLGAGTRLRLDLPAEMPT